MTFTLRFNTHTQKKYIYIYLKRKKKTKFLFYFFWKQNVFFTFNTSLLTHKKHCFWFFSFLFFFFTKISSFLFFSVFFSPSFILFLFSKKFFSYNYVTKNFLFKSNNQSEHTHTHTHKKKKSIWKYYKELKWVQKLYDKKNRQINQLTNWIVYCFLKITVTTAQLNFNFTTVPKKLSVIFTVK